MRDTPAVLRRCPLNAIDAVPARTSSSTRLPAHIPQRDLRRLALFELLRAKLRECGRISTAGAGADIDAGVGLGGYYTPIPFELPPKAMAEGLDPKCARDARRYLGADPRRDARPSPSELTRAPVVPATSSSRPCSLRRGCSARAHGTRGATRSCWSASIGTASDQTHRRKARRPDRRRRRRARTPRCSSTDRSGSACACSRSSSRISPPRRGRRRRWRRRRRRESSTTGAATRRRACASRCASTSQRRARWRAASSASGQRRSRRFSRRRTRCAAAASWCLWRACRRARA